MKSLTDDEIEVIAEKAAEKAVDKLTKQIYEEIGRKVVVKFFTLVGIIVVGLGGWAAAKGWL